MPFSPPARLRADCGSCVALCCVAPAFVRSADFPVTKPAGVPCVHLAGTACSVHDRLRPLGFAGCVAYDCFGAGQAVTAMPVAAGERYAVLPVLRQVHELLWYLAEASGLAPSPRLAAATARVEDLAALPAADLLALDVSAERARVAPLLIAAAAEARRSLDPPSVDPRSVDPRTGGRGGGGRGGGGRAGGSRAGGGRAGGETVGVDRVGADLAGADLSGRDLSGWVLRSATLIGASLRGATLHAAELLGADLRNADLSGADLSGAVYLTASQVGAALGSPATRLPPSLAHPPHWR